jgi:predicted mannosyl-3-phosphoglycerate phosphatase (HAD superfamily)
MKTNGIAEIKKTIKNISQAELSEICLKLARFKKDNKEYIHFLLFESSDPFAYAEDIKESLHDALTSLNRHPSLKVKELRKHLRVLSRHIRYTSSTEVEISLLIWFTEMMVKHAGVRQSNKALYTLFIRQIEKIRKSFPKLHEDLQFDYMQPYNDLLAQAADHITGFNKDQYPL